MNFAWPHLLWLLALPAALLAWELVRSRRLTGTVHPKILRAEAGLRQVSLSTESEAPIYSSRRRLLLCAGLALGVLALARPQWGRLDEPVFDQSRDIVIALDLSRSMLTPDVKPNRLERAKLLIQSLLDSLHGERVGLVVFSGTAFLQSPVSADYEILREFLPSLGPDFLPEGGTNYRDLLDASIEAFGGGTAADRYLIILSDGEATDDNWRDGVDALTKRGIRVIGLGVGTGSGGMIPDGAGAFMKDENGAVVKSKLEAGTLRELAKATHGVYQDASAWIDLPKLVAATVDQGRKGSFVEHRNVRLVERYQWALALALACFLASLWLEFPVRPKSREIRLSGPAPAKLASKLAAAATCLAALFLGVRFVRAAETAADPAATLSKVVGRLSAQDRWSAVDWSELGRETVDWGQHLQSGGRPVPEGPVRDALAAVDLGKNADPKVTDWEKMRSELENLLKKPEDKKQDQQNQQQQQQQNQNQQKDQKQQSGGEQKQNQERQPDQNGQKQDQKPPPPQNQQQQNSDSSSGGNDKSQAPSPGKQDAFGKMGKPGTPPPARDGNSNPSPMQTVGGPRSATDRDPARNNPELAVPLEKLEQVRNQDSPAQLFELLRRGEPNPPPKNTGKNW